MTRPGQDGNGDRERLRGVIGDPLVDAPPQFCWLVEEDEHLVEARLRGGYIPQYLMWLSERPQPALRTLVLEQSSMRDFAPMVQLLAAVEAPVLRTLVFGGPAGAGARLLTLNALPMAHLPQLEHLAIEARIPEALIAALATATRLRTLTLHTEPKAPPVDLSGLSTIIDAVEPLTEIHLFGPFEAESAEAIVTSAPERIAHVEIDCLGGPRLVRTTPERDAFRTAMTTRPAADPWWTSELPGPTRLSVSTVQGTTTYAAELASTRVLGRRTEVSASHRLDQQLWHGRPHGLQVTERGGRVFVQHFDRGVQLQMDLYGDDGSLTERRYFEDGRVSRKEKVDATPAPPAFKPKAGAAYESDFSGRSNECLEVLETVSWTTPDEVPADVAALLVARFGEHADEPTLVGVFGLTDDHTFARHRCKVVATGRTLDVVCSHFGDTLVGIGMQDGRTVATLDDCYLAPTR